MRNLPIWSVALAGATGVVNCSIQGLPADGSGGAAGAHAGNGGAKPSGHSGTAGKEAPYLQ
ncbi:MAG TPA: hypothetical protein VHW01_16220 [Polyangiaceae bacterium]|nr:hypothetical protein [Polyangiaceae bacterium]